MPRDGSNVYHRPPGTDGVSNTTIESAKYNSFTADVEQDLNTPRPIVAGGTGATSALNAIIALGGEVAGQVVTNYDSFPFNNGSFYSATTATNPPVAGHAFVGICYATDSSNIVIEARDQNDTTTPGRMYVREKKAGVWGAWNSDLILPADVLRTTGNQTTTGGFRFTTVILTLTGTVTPNALLGNYQAGNNVGAFTLAAPAADCAIDILVNNTASAGTITFSGYTVGTNKGDLLTNTNGQVFIISIRRIQGFSTYVIKALQ